MTMAYQMLLVEDDKIARLTGKTLLAQAGCTVWVATSAKEAQLMANTQRFSGILMDVGLPDGDGLSVCEQIRHTHHGLNCHTPIWVVTAHLDAAKEQSRCDALRLQVIHKPLRADHIRAMMAKLIPYHHLPLFDQKQALDWHPDQTAMQQAWRMFQAELTASQENIAVHYQAENWSALCHVIHKLHGAALYSSTTRLNGVLHDMETLLRQHPVPVDQVRDGYLSLTQTMQATLAHTIPHDSVDNAID